MTAISKAFHPALVTHMEYCQKLRLLGHMVSSSQYLVLSSLPSKFFITD